MYNRQYLFLFSDTASPTNYTLLRPAVIILCYSIAEPASLESVKTHWKHVVETHFNYDESIPVILLGLNRDVRVKEDYDGNVRPMAGTGDGDGEVLVGRRIVYPQEALRIAQEMRCDRYCECSALTGEVSLTYDPNHTVAWLTHSWLQLCHEAFEDLARTACKTTTAKGGKSDAHYCSIM